MARKKLLLDTNVIIDFLRMREPRFESARLLMIAGKVGEFSLWMSSSQITDLIYILSDGGKRSLMNETLRMLRGIRPIVNVASVTANETDKILETTWKDPEDALLFEIALKLHADAIITSNAKDFESDAIRVLSADEFFETLLEEEGLSYDFVSV